MTQGEFKAWFEGFSENIDKPNKAQWKRIKARVKDIDGTPVTPTIIREYVDRYINRPYYYGPYWHTTDMTITCNSTSLNSDYITSNSSTTASLAMMGAEESLQLS